MSSVTLWGVDVVVAQLLLQRNARSVSAPRDPRAWLEESFMSTQGWMWGLPPSINSALSWQPLCCSLKVRGVKCGGVWKVCDVFRAVQDSANRICPRACSIFAWISQKNLEFHAFACTFLQCGAE
ncbi:hypothetical protein C7974DRAFT_80207 [Boeremia exigua]|uniref:uncharacterized protein n=1 Tax=Boeremia exigua TaxID=749465 RepID=UPI001E8DEC15|nr:uncharacterized protein C7974DRAFT_80207 [Boeremia exigua]KAH6612557.1 hypothetical protein C7974DRAFT_80207 [Boeremia exigua]